MKTIFSNNRLLYVAKWSTLVLSSTLLLVLYFQTWTLSVSFFELIQTNLLMNVLLMVSVLNFISFLELHVLLGRLDDENWNRTFPVLATIWLAQAAMMNFVSTILLGYGMLIQQRTNETSWKKSLIAWIRDRNKGWILANIGMFVVMITIIYVSLYYLF